MLTKIKPLWVKCSPSDRSMHVRDQRKPCSMKLEVSFQTSYCSLERNKIRKLELFTVNVNIMRPGKKKLNQHYIQAPAFGVVEQALDWI